MFTGLIREVGQVQWLKTGSGGRKLAVSSNTVAKDAKAGDSIAVNGVCLTVTEIADGVLYFDVTEETCSRSNLADMKKGDAVNLEASVKAGGAFQGHFVLGHVDCAGRITAMGRDGRGFYLNVAVPVTFGHLTVPKGSIAVDGVSLTIAEAGKSAFRAYIIPHTLDNTNFGKRKAGDSVNVEFDIIGKYVARFSGYGETGGITEKFLRERGF